MCYQAEPFDYYSNKLPVETQRYLDLERSQRLCPLCNSGVGNELHYFLECNYSDFAELRTSFSSSIKDLHPTIQNPSIWLISRLNSQKPKVLGKVGSFISTVMDYFNVLNTNIRSYKSSSPIPSVIIISARLIVIYFTLV